MLGLGLIAPVAEAAGENAATRYLVHRWTSTALGGLADPDELTDAHRRAAGHWRWRVAVAPQDRVTDINQLLEARHHHISAGDVDAAFTAPYQVIDQLNTWGAWSWVDDLCRETLAWVPPDPGPRRAHPPTRHDRAAAGGLRAGRAALPGRADDSGGDR